MLARFDVAVDNAPCGFAPPSIASRPRRDSEIQQPEVGDGRRPLLLPIDLSRGLWPPQQLPSR